MNLHHMLLSRAAVERPIRVGLIGAGKFGAMFLAQAARTPGLAIAAIADLDLDRARAACRTVGWSAERIAATRFLEDGQALAALDAVEVVIEATGAPQAGAVHALASIGAGKAVIMVNVETDALCGPALAARARSAGVLYSLAYGDQPALIAEMVDWARACGFTVAAAGKGTKHLPAYHASTPDDVWRHYGVSPEAAAKAGMNPKMFNSFLDGAKSAIEMTAVANACGLAAPPGGLAFPPCGAEDLAHVLRPKAIGGVLEREGVVEVVSSLERDGRPTPRDLRWGVYVVLKAETDYAAACFAQYGLKVDETGRYAAMYKPFHLIGLELGISVASVALRGEPTGQPRAFRADAAAVAKRALAPGETLDGEGGRTVYATTIPAAESLATGAVPIGLTDHLRIIRPVAAGAVLRWADVAEPAPSAALTLRRETEALAAGS